MATAAVRTDHETDWQEYIPQHRKEPDRRSPLLKARAMFPHEVPNCCPFDKDLGHYDEKQYCPHVVGFTDPEDGIDPDDLPTTFYPVKPRRDKDGKPLRGQVFVDGTDRRPILPSDKLVWVSNCYRVYRLTVESVEPKSDK